MQIILWLTKTNNQQWGRQENRKVVTKQFFVDSNPIMRVENVAVLAFHFL